ncbi:hypothetical protein ABBQ32_010809 [Trebouxia sp. C0010 RCD-2024]
MGLNKSGRSDAIEVATCFGITDIWVVASADASDLQADFKQTPNAGQGKLPAAAALALTLHHCTANTDAQPAPQHRLHRSESREDAGQQPNVSNGLPTDSDGQSEQSTVKSVPKQNTAPASAKLAAASDNASPSLPPEAGAPEAEASASLATSSATADTSSDSPEVSNSQADDSSSAESQAATEPALPAVQHADSAPGSDTPQLSQKLSLLPDHETSPGPRSDASLSAAKSGGLAGAPTGVGASNGEHGDDGSSVRSQDTTASRASKLQASEMSRLQAQAMRRSGVMRRHGMAGPGGSRPTSSMGSPTGSVASVSTAGWPDYSPYK